MRTLHIITPLVAVGLDRQLRGGAPLRRSLFDEVIRSSESLEFRDGDESLSVDEWADGLAERGASGAELTHALGKPAQVGGAEVPERMLAGFAGPSGLLLAVRRSDAEIDLYQPGEAFPRRTLLEVDDLLAFVEGFPRRAELQDALVWQAEHNLGFPAGVTWDEFVAALGPPDAERLTNALGRCMSNVRFEKECDLWMALVKRHRNPETGAIFRFVRRGPVAGLPEPPPVEDQTARLSAAVQAAAAFAAKHDLGDWADHFNKVVGTLSDAPLAETPFYPVFRGCGLAEARIRLVVGAFFANVFGGMGSWNDLPFANEEEYGQVSEALFRELHPSMVSAVGSAHRLQSGPE